MGVHQIWSTFVGFEKTLDDIWMIYPGKLSLRNSGVSNEVNENGNAAVW